MKRKAKYDSEYMYRCTTKVLEEQFYILVTESEEASNEADEIMKVLKRRDQGKRRRRG